MRKIHSDLIATRQLMFQLLGIHFHHMEPEPESQDYGACTFKSEGVRVKFRSAKITPKKVGQFVTFWKRGNDGSVQPYDTEDDFQSLVVSVRCQGRFGHFVFPKDILFQYGILSRSGKGGKRAVRIYPPWDQPTSRQAQKTQAWQLAYFKESHADASFDTQDTQTRAALQEAL